MKYHYLIIGLKGKMMIEQNIRTFVKESLQKYKATLWNGRVCTIEKSLCLVILPIFLSYFVDEVYYHRDVAAAVYLFVLYSLVFCAFILIWTVSSFIWFYFLNKYVVDIRVRLFKKFCYLKQTKQDKLDTAEIEVLLTSDATKFNDELASNYIDIFNYLVGFALSLIVVLKYDFFVFLVVAVVVPTSYFLNRIIAQKGEKHNSIRRRLYGDFNNKVLENLKSMHQIKVNDAKDVVFAEYTRHVRNLISEEKKLLFYDYFSVKVNELISLVMSIMIYVIMAFEYSKGNITVGNIIAILEYVNIIKNSFAWFGQNLYDTKTRKIHLEKVVEFLNYDSEIESVSMPNIQVTDGKISFCDVSFAYNDNLIVEKANLEIKPFSKTALIGANGVGKTTLVKLLLGLYDIKEGNILVDNQPISECSYKSLRSQISYVSQNVTVFPGTIRDNICLWNSHYTDYDISIACQKASIWEVIQSLPNQLDTILDGQVNLSMGQKQRLLLARVFLQNRPIVIWDEATASLDSVSETEVINKLCEYSEQKTVIIITHTINSLLICDDVVVLEDKKLNKYAKTDSGLKEHRLYREMVNIK